MILSPKERGFIVNSEMRALSTIEMTVLAITWRLGPCTTYSVMKVFGSSESSYYKSRAGTVYSVVNRLIGFGLIEQEEPSGPVHVSETGVEKIKQWLRPPVPLEEVTFTADRIRLRFFFLDILPVSERLEFIDSTLASLSAQLIRNEALIVENEAEGDRYGALATLSVVFETKARIQWLETVREQVAAEQPASPICNVE